LIVNAGYITVDQPPATFWAQALLARILGVNGWSVM
jgi:4-amino-4-deoxy-L-arabinose transferase-like glycosyltransferase